MGAHVGNLYLFQPFGEAGVQTPGLEERPRLPIKPIRLFDKVLDEIWRVIAVPRGIIVIGKKQRDSISVLFYDFAFDNG